MTHIDFYLESEVLHTNHFVLECYVEASTPPSMNVQNDSNYTATWLLVLVFERLVLAPNQDPDISTRQTLYEHVRLF